MSKKTAKRRTEAVQEGNLSPKRKGKKGKNNINDYKLKKKLGAGAFAEVRLC